MKNSKRPESWKRYIFPVLLLAVLCIGAVELIVCAYQAPDLYQAITAPVRSAVQRLAGAGDLAWDGLRRHTDEAVARGVSQVQEGLRRLDEYFTREPEPEELPEEAQLLDREAVLPPPDEAQAPFTITALVDRNGTEYLTGGGLELIYYNQTDETWAEQPYGSDTIGRYGCGPVVMSMVVSTLSGEIVNPSQMAQHCVDRGYWAKRHGSYWSIVPGAAADFGLTCTPLPPEETDKDTIVHCLSTGQLLVALVGPGHFTNGGHFIILRSTTLDGSVLVADPASLDRTLTTWDLDLILEELSQGRSDGGPLWAISRTLAP